MSVEPTSETPMSVTELHERLALAEAVCLMYGWSSACDETDRGKATYELWRRWVAAVPKSFTDPKQHPELSDARIAELAKQRDERRAATLARFGMADDV